MNKFKLVCIINYLIFVISLFLAIGFGHEVREHKKLITENAQYDVQLEGDSAAKQINEQLKQFQKTADNLAEQLTQKVIAYSQIETSLGNMIQTSVNNKEKIFAVGVALEKGLYTDSSTINGLFSRFFFYNDETNKITLNTSSSYDYTLKTITNHDTSWYTKAVEDKKSFWQEPKLSTNVHKFIVGYSVPFYTSPNKTKIAGVVTVNYYLDDLQYIMTEKNFAKTGYGVIFSAKGKLIYYHDKLLVNSVLSNKVDFEADKLDFLYALKNNIERNDIIPLINEYGDKVWVIFKEVPSTQWKLGVIVIEKELQLEEHLINYIVLFIIFSVILAISLSFCILEKCKRYINYLWYFSMCSTLIFATGIYFLWGLSNLRIESKNKNVNNVVLSNFHDINNFKTKHTRQSNDLQLVTPYYIPTGVFIKTVNFTGANNLTITGYVWQKYNVGKKIPIEKFCDFISEQVPLRKGVILVDAVEDEIDLNCSQQNFYDVDENGTYTIGFYFKKEFREPFNYQDYPFDKNVISLKLRHLEIVNGATLVPDLESYDAIYNSANAGIEESNFILPGWNLLGTNFSYRYGSYNTTFGIHNYQSHGHAPELYFNINIGRQFLDPFISTVSPIIMIILILFAVLLSSTDHEQKAERFGFNAFGVFAIITGLLFSVALWHSTLRSSLASSGITYFETFYFVCYFLIAFVGLNSYVLSSEQYIKIIHYEHNLIPKLVFMPLTMCIIFAITLFMLF